jgi:tripartite ATP-independent transporter DctM subunit
VLLGDVMSNAYQQAQLSAGVFSTQTVSVGDLFTGAIVPGLLLVVCYLIYMILVARFRPASAPAAKASDLAILDGDQPLAKSLALGLLPPLLLILAVMGSIISGAATPTEAAGVGAVGALLLALIKGQLSFPILRDVSTATVRVTSMVFLILIGASIFSLVFRGFGGDIVVEDFFTNLPGGVVMATIMVMLVVFLLGFILDFIEITYMVVPIVGPVLLAMGLDPIWLGVMLAVNLQTSFLTPPFGFALFYLRGAASDQLTTRDMYRGVVPYIIIQLLVLGLLALWPQLATWLPGQL